MLPGFTGVLHYEQQEIPFYLNPTFNEDADAIEALEPGESLLLFYDSHEQKDKDYLIRTILEEFSYSLEDKLCNSEIKELIDRLKIDDIGPTQHFIDKDLVEVQVHEEEIKMQDWATGGFFKITNPEYNNESYMYKMKSELETR
ncbi:hypothetical protein_gp194 [Bacillus phage vB_BceM_WH1]|nr:hypothetical protein_gp194 [Bacillus phage vB_BceM_WH1]